MRAMQASGALEILYLRGALDVQSAQHQLQLDPGNWLLARWSPNDIPMDGWAAPMPPVDATPQESA